MKKTIYCAIAAMAFAGIFTACEEKAKVDEVVLSGETAEISMSVGVFSSVNNAAQYASADDVYDKGVGNTPIKNITVIPMVGASNVQTPITFENITNADGDSKSKPVNASIAKETDRFLVYANAEGVGTLDKTFDLVSAGITGKDLYKPFPVFLFKDAKDFKVGKDADFSQATTGWEDFSGITDFDWANYNCVKIEGVTYGIGTLATAIKHGDYSKQSVTVGGEKKEGDAMKTWLSDPANIKLTAVTVEKQPKSLKFDMTKNGTETATIYETVNKSDFSDVKLDDTNRSEKANAFIVVAQEAEGVAFAVNYEFKNLSGSEITFEGTEGTVTIGADDEFYIAAPLDPNKQTITNPGKTFFQKEYMTYLTATITHWENATTEIQTLVDIKIGVEFDLGWKKGGIYEVEI